MRPIFTIHAGEYLTGTYIEENLRQFDLWVPAKDTGVDLLLTNPRNAKRVGLQVKFSKDFSTTHFPPGLQSDLVTYGWWTLDREKMRRSKADFWVFVLYGFQSHHTQFVIIKPARLLKVLASIHGRLNSYSVYFWVTKKHRCWEARNLNAADTRAIAADLYFNPRRDVTEFLNDWKSIRKALK